MFATVRQFVQLQEEAKAGPEGPNADGHYLWFKGVPNPPAEYIAPKGASPYTWPAIYHNMENMDYCVSNFAHLGNRIKCQKAFAPTPLLP